jgi:putative SOS response-associated peptidase YedK
MWTPPAWPPRRSAASMSKIHDRHAVILEPREYAEWLKESERPPLHLLRILPDEDLVIDPLGTQSKTETPGRAAPPAQSGFLFD